MLKTQKQVPVVEKLYDTLHLVWKTYHFSAKSRRELNHLGTELGANIRVASNVKGTRWVPHVQRALEVFLTGIPKDGDLVEMLVSLQQHLSIWKTLPRHQKTLTSRAERKR